jgi:hypothetical protein
MKATYTKPTGESFTTRHRMEKHFHGSVILLDLADPRGPDEVITVRFYGTPATNTCCLWVSGDARCTSGSGRATGCGYHRPSAAFEEAAQRAGFTFDRPVEGRGDSVVAEALLAMSVAVGVVKPFVVEAWP